MKTPFIIAEVGQAHEGSLGILHSYIDALSATGVNAIKFQTHIAEAESSPEEPFRINFSYEDSSRFHYWERMGFTLTQWKEIKSHCDDLSIEFMSSPFSNKAVDWLEEIGVKRYKIGSGEVTNLLLLERIRQTGKPVILSSGMSNYNELDLAVEFLLDQKIELGVVQCTTAYPTPFEKLGLNVLSELKDRYPSATIGISEHTGKPHACIAAAALGAQIFEFHAVFDRRMFGPDSSSSMTIDEIKYTVNCIHDIFTAHRNPVDKNDISELKDLKEIFEKSLAVNRDIEVGEIIQFSDLEGKKPAGQGVPARKYKEIIGKKTVRRLSQWEFLKPEDVI